MTLLSWFGLTLTTAAACCAMSSQVGAELPGHRNARQISVEQKARLAVCRRPPHAHAAPNIQICASHDPTGIEATTAQIGLIGVAIGAWLQSRTEHQRWLRDQKLRAAIDFIGGTGDLYQR